MTILNSKVTTLGLVLVALVSTVSSAGTDRFYEIRCSGATGKTCMQCHFRRDDRLIPGRKNANGIKKNEVCQGCNGEGTVLGGCGFAYPYVLRLKFNGAKRTRFFLTEWANILMVMLSVGINPESHLADGKYQAVIRQQYYKRWQRLHHKHNPNCKEMKGTIRKWSGVNLPEKGKSKSITLFTVRKQHRNARKSDVLDATKMFRQAPVDLNSNSYCVKCGDGVKDKKLNKEKGYFPCTKCGGKWIEIPPLYAALQAASERYTSKSQRQQASAPAVLSMATVKGRNSISIGSCPKTTPAGIRKIQLEHVLRDSLDRARGSLLPRRSVASNLCSAPGSRMSKRLKRHATGSIKTLEARGVTRRLAAGSLINRLLRAERCQ